MEKFFFFCGPSSKSLLSAKFVVVGRCFMKSMDDDVFNTTSWSEQINEQESDQTVVEFQVFA